MSIKYVYQMQIVIIFIMQRLVNVFTILDMSKKYDRAEVIKRLEEARMKTGLSERALSIKAKLSPPRYHQIVKKGSEPTAGVLVDLADALGVSASWLLYGTDITPQAEEILDLLQKNPEKRDAILALLRG